MLYSKCTCTQFALDKFNTLSKNHIFILIDKNMNKKSHEKQVIQ